MVTPSYERQTMIDRITYTASLVTRVREVDPYLDKLRAITARTDFSPQNMTDEQYATLVSLQQQLESYLVERESLRSFTPESLQVQIEQHLAGNQNARRGLTQMMTVLGIAGVAAVVVGLLPITSQDTQQHIILTGAVTSSVMNLGAAWLFVSALAAFKSQLRRAFIFICTGIVIFCLSILAQPLIELWSLRASSDITTLIIMPAVLISTGFIYAGIAKYAALAGVISRLLSVKTLLTFAIPLAVAAFLIPAPAAQDSKIIFSLSILMHLWVVLLAIMSVIVLMKVRSHVADLYKPPVRALLQAIVALILGAIVFAGLIADAGPRLTSPMAVGLFTFLLIMGGMLVRAGYKFNKISRY